jgi:hypothetical protein
MIEVLEDALGRKGEENACIDMQRVTWPAHVCRRGPTLARDVGSRPRTSNRGRRLRRFVRSGTMSYHQHRAARRHGVRGDRPERRRVSGRPRSCDFSGGVGGTP